MHLIFVEDLPSHLHGRYAHYKHRKNVKEGWEYCDIRALIGKNQDQWLKDVEHWHSDLSKVMLKYTRWWWLLPASRLIAWYPPILNPLFFAIAVIEYCKISNKDELYLVACPDDVFYYLKEFRSDYNLSFSAPSRSIDTSPRGERTYKKSHKNIISEKKGEIRLRFLNNIKQLLLLARRCLFNRVPVENIKQAKAMVFSYALKSNALGNQEDHFFCKMFDQHSLSDNNNITWVYHTRFGQKIRIKDNRLKEDNIVFLYDFLTLSDFIKVLQESWLLFRLLKRIKNELPLMKVSVYQSKIFTEIYFSEMMENSLPITEISAYFAIKRILEHSKIRVIIYPYEEKGIERAIIQACRTDLRYVRTVSFAHAVYNKGLLYLRNRPSGLENSPKPDIIAAPGPSLKKWLIDWAEITPERLEVIGSPRYHKRLPLRENIEGHQAPLRVLIIIGQWYELDILANYVEERKDIFDNCEILVRLYPYSWNKQQDEGLKRLRRLLRSVQIGAGELTDQINWCDVAIYSSTSAGLEAMLCGRLAIYLELHDIFVLDPMDGKGDLSNIYRCDTPNELKDILSKISSMDNEKYLREVDKQYNFASAVYSPIDHDKINQLISSEGSTH